MHLKKIALTMGLAVLFSAFSAQAKEPTNLAPNYTLDEMVVLSRHNIRSPLSGNGSALGNLTSHKWFQ